MKRIAEFKEKHKALLENLLPEDEKDAFINHNVVNVLKDRDHKGRRVLVVNCGGKLFCFRSNLRCLNKLLETQEINCIYGHVSIKSFP